MKYPSPSEIRAAREACGLTQSEAAALIYKPLRTWQNWEAVIGTQNYRPMDPALFELFIIKTWRLCPTN